MADPVDPKNPPVDTAETAKVAENTAKMSKEAEQFDKWLKGSKISTDEIRQNLEQINKDIALGNKQGRSNLEMEMKRVELQKEYNERLIEQNKSKLDQLKKSENINEEEKKRLELAIETLEVENRNLSIKDKQIGQWKGINDQASALLSSMTGVTGRSETMLSAIAEAGMEAGNFGGAFNAARIAIDKIGRAHV